MSTLEQQLGAIGRHLEAEAPPITMAEIYARLDADADTNTGTTASTTSTTSTTKREHHVMTLTAVEPDTPSQSGNGSKRPWLLVAAAAAVVVLVLIGGLIATSGGSDDAPVPVDEPEPTAPIVDDEAEGIEDEDSAVDAESLPFPGVAMAAGRYETEQLGVPATFEVPEDTNLWVMTPNRIVLWDPDQYSDPVPVEPRRLTLNRISSWSNPDEAVDQLFVGPGSIDPYDIAGWIEANDLVATDLTTTEVAGRPATVVDVQLEDVPANQDFFCLAAQSCRWAASISGERVGSRVDAEPWLSSGQVNRLWLITIEGEDPMLIHAAAGSGDEAWLDLVEQTTIATLELGPDAPPLG